MANVLPAVMLGVMSVSSLRPAVAEDISFKGKQVTILIGYGSGGSYDLYGRLVARYLSKHLPGTPTVVAQNMVGAGSLTMANYLYNIAPKNGTYVGVVGQTLPVDQLLDGKGMNFDSAKFAWIGRMASGVETVVSWYTTPVKTIEDAKHNQIAIAATGPSSGAAIYPILLNNLVGTKFKVIRGYDGTKEMLLSMERGETGGCGALNVATLTSQFSEWMRDEKVHVLAQISVNRHPAIANTPTIVELATNEDDQKVMKLFAVSGDIGRSLAAPPGLAPDMVAVLRSSFMATMNDSELLEYAKKSNLDIEPMDGAALQKLVEEVGTFPKSVITRAIAAKKDGA
jgi:tripartite-type tricarboxylate transporter receptor subunit TctC